MGDMSEEIWVLTRHSVLRRMSGGEDRKALEEAWKYFFEHYREPIERSLRRHLRGHGDADEACAEFFAYLLESHALPRFDAGSGRFRAYLQGILRNYALGWLRQRRSKSSDIDIQSVEASFEEEMLWVEQEESEWAGAVLGAALARMRRDAPRGADMLLRAYGIPPFEEVPRAQLAEDLGIKTSALNVALLEARRKLGGFLISELRDQVSSRTDFERERELMVARLLSQRPSLLADLQADLAADPSDVA